MKLIGNKSQRVGPEDAPMEVHLLLAGFAGAPCRAVLMETE